MGARVVVGGASFDPLQGWPIDNKEFVALRERRRAMERRLDESGPTITPRDIVLAMEIQEGVLSTSHA